ncbi:MAG: serine/threonine protein kinase [Myxococcales bacterium]|nr:serine/threonine protein kinase [Myxococcales bacterium]
MVQFDPERTLLPEEFDAPDPSDVLVGRYLVGTMLGRGGAGQVHRATDLLTDDHVAVKFVRLGTPTAAQQLERELTALRLLDLPGVVRLLDDGAIEDEAFLVMPLLEHGTFATLGQRGPWPTWRDELLTVLEALARIHFLGIVHGDLKPNNILLDAQHRPVITDFGVAMGHAVVDPGSWRAGTRHYMAPEQLAGALCDARTDLYAIGVMLRDMTRGETCELGAVLDRMTAPDPRDRPASAVEVLEALGRTSTSLFGSVAALPQQTDHTALTDLFVDTSPTFLHIAEDAARLLLRRTQGRRQRVQAELDRWVRAGRCRWHQGRITLDRRALDALEAEDRPPSEATLQAARMAHAAGRTAHGLSILQTLASADRPDVAEAVVDLTLTLWDATRLRQAIYLAERHGWQEARRLLCAARVISQGHCARGLAMIRQQPPATSTAIEGWRLGLAIFAASRSGVGDPSPWLALADAWADDDPARQARVASWRARTAYRQARYAEALMLERRALAGSDAPGVRLSRLTTAAAAALEVPSMEEAGAWADEARALARALRHPTAEARSLWLQRTVALRSGHPLPPCATWVDAAEAVAPGIAAQVAFTEAASAWRLGQRQLAGTLAGRSTQLFTTVGQDGAATLARALAWTCGTCSAPTPRAIEQAPDELALQIHALLARHGTPMRPPSVDWAQIRGRRLDLLSGEECYAALIGG